MRLAGVVEHLVHGELGLEIVEGVGAVQGADVEVLRAKLMLGQQGTEDIHGVIAAGKRFGVVDLGKDSAMGLRHPGVGCLHRRAGRRDRRVRVERQADGVTQRERLLGEHSRGQDEKC